MDKIELKVVNREILGKKVKHLRRQGITPVHVFGHGIESLALQCDTKELERVLSQAGQTRLVNLKLAKEKKPRTVVVREFDRDWRRGQLVHVDFYQVRMEEKLRLEIPIVLIGEAPALKSKTNMLDHELGTLTVECLPAKIPNSFEVDISFFGRARSGNTRQRYHAGQRYHGPQPTRTWLWPKSVCDLWKRWKRRWWRKQ